MTPGKSLRPDVTPVPLNQLIQGINGSLPSSWIVDISGVSVDSLDIEPGWVFVGIGGLNHHGAKFIPAALAAGAVAVVTDEAGAKYAKGFDVPLVIVDDPRKAAADISIRLYGQAVEKLTLAAVTGTNGKTTTSYMLRSALARHYGRVGLMATGAMDVDDEPQYMLRTTAEAPVVQRALAVASNGGSKAAVVEVSAHAMSLHRLRGLKFASTVFTNLQHDHLDYYKTMENYFEAKARLFDPNMSQQGTICVDDEWGRHLANEAKVPIWTVSALTPTPAGFEGSETHWYVKDFGPVSGKWGIGFELVSPKGQTYKCFSPIPGAVNVQNAAAAILSAVQCGVDIAEAIKGVANTPAIAGRMELIEGDAERQPNVLVDYAHTPEALEALLQTVRPLVPGNLVLVFGTDGDRDTSKREELGQIAARSADVLWVTDENPRSEDPQSIRDYLLRGIASVRSDMADVTEVKQCRRDATRMAIQAAGPGDLVIITGKGSEAAQEVQGVFHAYSDTIVANEVLNAPL